jgi:hypothetical protein
MAGVAVDSPADAASFHPALFASANEAKLAFRRDAFKGQNPIRVTYREVTLKSAAYRRAGQGRGWQNAFWNGAADEIRSLVEVPLSRRAGWEPVQEHLGDPPRELTGRRLGA